MLRDNLFFDLQLLSYCDLESLRYRVPAQATSTYSTTFSSLDLSGWCELHANQKDLVTN